MNILHGWIDLQSDLISQTTTIEIRNQGALKVGSTVHVVRELVANSALIRGRSYPSSQIQVCVRPLEGLLIPADQAQVRPWAEREPS